MRVSELSERTGVPVATVKYYLREGLLHAGTPLNPRQSSYDDTHVTRLKLIRGLVRGLGASIEQTKQILAIIDTPDQTVLAAMGRATDAALAAPVDEGDPEDGQYAATEDVLNRLGFTHEAGSSEVRRLDAALRVAADAGISLEDEQFAAYARAARDIAAADFARIPWRDTKAAVEYAVLGTTLSEPVILALRRLAHQELALTISQEGHEGSGPK